MNFCLFSKFKEINLISQRFLIEQTDFFIDSHSFVLTRFEELIVNVTNPAASCFPKLFKNYPVICADLVLMQS